MLITGASGFLGGAFQSFLSHNKSFEIFSVDIKCISTKKRNFDCDLCNKEKVRSILLNIRPDYIFHFAGGRVQQEDVLLKTNFLTTKVLFNAILSIADYKPRVIIPGSAAEYGTMGRTKSRMEERANAQPNSWYGFVKLIQTNLALFYAAQGVDVVIGRIFNISGKGAPPDLCVGRFAEQIILIEKSKGRKEIATFNLNSVRDFLDINDVCCALLAIAKKGKTGEIYNICSGAGLSIRDLLTMLLQYSKAKDISVNEKVECFGSIHKSIGSNAKVRKATGWQPDISMEKSLKDTLKYYRHQR